MTGTGAGGGGGDGSNEADDVTAVCDGEWFSCCENVAKLVAVSLDWDTIVGDGDAGLY